MGADIADEKAAAVSDSKQKSVPERTPDLQLDQGVERATYREKWWQVWRPKDPPPKAPASFEDAQITPLATASLFSILTYTWITDIMVLGYQRTLQATDLYKLDESRSVDGLSATLDAAWTRRVSEAKRWNEQLAAGDIRPSLMQRATWSIRAAVHPTTYRDTRQNLEREWREITGLKRPSLAWAMNDTFGRSFWIGGVFKVLGDTMQLMCPLLIRAIINFSKEVAADKEDGTTPPNIGRGVGMAIGLFLLTACASIGQHQFFWRSMQTGVLARGALICSTYKKGVMLTPKARTSYPNALLMNYVSSDISRIDAAAQWFHASWTAPIQVMVCLIILLVQLGPSALAGFSLFALIVPIQERIMAKQFAVRKESMTYTDRRAKLLLEVLGAMRIVKYFTYEVPFLQRIFRIRKSELEGVRKIQFARSANVAMANSIPVLAATLSFVTYTLTNKTFDAAIIFSSFSLFQLLRQPMMFLPRALSAITDAHNAVIRLAEVFGAETMADSEAAVETSENLKFAVQLDNVTFEWEEGRGDFDETDPENDMEKEKESVEVSEADAIPTQPKARRPFQIQNVSMTVERGTLVAVVGPVGCGKSSLLQGMIGEMRKVSGSVLFSGRVGYCPQTAWIQNATLRDNILFGQPFDEDRYWKAVEDASLLQDLDVLPGGDMTEIGEKGINLSGGQKQRVSIARALYFDADIVLADDALSAVDAHVGRALFTNAFLGALRGRGKTVILVTHALYFLPEVDYIYALRDGHIAEHGTYDDLLARNGEFARLDREFGGQGRAQKTEEDEEEAIEAAPSNAPKSLDIAHVRSKVEKNRSHVKNKLEGRLMVAEKRETGSVPWKVNQSYISAGRGWLTGPFIAIFILLMQCSQIFNSYTLVWWQANTFNQPFSFYQILYACLGISQSIFTFLAGIAMDSFAFFVSQNLHHDALTRIFFAPMSFFDTNPMGRILGIFGKDFDSIDDQLPVSMRLFVITLANVIGALVIITILEHYFILAAALILLGYAYIFRFYKASARELKRLDGMLRSVLYSHFSESLSGLATIRSYGEMPRFLRDNKYYVDLENRALFLTVTNQRWLSVRLDFLGALMVFLVAIFAVVGVSNISPSQVSLVLTYTTNLTQLCGMFTRQTAEVENYMTSVERVVHYSRLGGVPQEAPYEKKDVKPPQEWPLRGAVEFKDVVMSYRPGLPSVLKGISINVQGGEKVGVVGRTGAGKSSLMLALFRIVELNSGSISIDGVDISTLGLKDLREKLSIIPQDPTILSGTVRSNLDPFSMFDDAHLWDALRRSYLVGTSTRSSLDMQPLDETEDRSEKFTLDTIIESDGANLSVGERSLLSLARALVKDSKVVILDEATASVDLETDSKIQRTIHTQFHDRTLLCIAHRLRTIVSYDRILVLNDGTVAEYDTPVNLFRKEGGIFRGMCERSHITLGEIEKRRELDFNDG